MPMLRTGPRILPVLLAFLAGSFPGDEDRFDPPVGGAYLGIAGAARSERVEVQRVLRGSAAESAGIAVGDAILRFDGKSGFRSIEDFLEAVQGARCGKPVEVEVLRGDIPKTIALTPDPEILRDHFEILSLWRRSSYLRSRRNFQEVLEEIESAVPGLIRSAGRASQAHEILHDAVGRLGASHLAFIPPWTYQNLFAGERDGTEPFTTGIILERTGDADRPLHFVREILDGSPAALAGVLEGDEVVRINGRTAECSPRRILAGYEARHPFFTIQVEKGERIELEIRRAPDRPAMALVLRIEQSVNGRAATVSSRRFLAREGRTLLYLHLWNLLSPGIPGILSEALESAEPYPEGIVLDLRGRGGQVAVMSRVVQRLRQDRRPLAILLDRDTRSAKEIAAFQMKGFPTAVLVGETTAGAVLPSTMAELPSGSRLMMPGDPSGISTLTDGQFLEGNGVWPDVAVRRAGLYSAGDDPILEAGIRSVLDRLKALPRRRRL